MDKQVGASDTTDNNDDEIYSLLIENEEMNRFTREQRQEMAASLLRHILECKIVLPPPSQLGIYRLEKVSYSNANLDGYYLSPLELATALALASYEDRPMLATTTIQFRYLDVDQKPSKIECVSQTNQHETLRQDILGCIGVCIGSSSPNDRIRIQIYHNVDQPSIVHDYVYQRLLLDCGKSTVLSLAACAFKSVFTRNPDVSLCRAFLQFQVPLIHVIEPSVFTFESETTRRFRGMSKGQKYRDDAYNHYLYYTVEDFFEYCKLFTDQLLQFLADHGPEDRGYSARVNLVFKSGMLLSDTSIIIEQSEVAFPLNIKQMAKELVDRNCWFEILWMPRGRFGWPVVKAVYAPIR